MIMFIRQSRVPKATAKDIVVRNGLKGLYRGLGPTMLGYLPTWAIYFTVYDGVKDWLGQGQEGEPVRQSPRRRTHLYLVILFKDLNANRVHGPTTSWHP